MNVLKNVLFFGLLIVVLCLVTYVLTNKQPEKPLPAGLVNDTAPVKVELPNPLGTPASNPVPDSGGNTPALPATPPAMGIPPAVPSGGMAPPYQPPPGAPSNMAPPSVPPAAPPFAPPSGVADGGLPPPPAGAPEQPSNLPPPPPGNYPPGVSDPTAPGGQASPPPGNYRDVAAAGNSSTSTAPPWPANTNSTPPATPNNPFSPPAANPFSPPATPPATPAPPTGLPSLNSAMPGLDLIMQQVKAKMDERKFADALLILSQVYDNPDVPPAQARKITDILDQMAAKVIYSREHLLEPVYYAQQGDTLDTVADRYQVPPLLLARINGLREQNLSPGTKLKVLKGPFSAYVSIDRAELTMKLSGRYAGRFPISLSNDLQQQSGLYTVSNKSRPAATADKLWIELSNVAGKIGIEGAADARSAARTARSTIWLSEQDMDDVYGILSVSSRVVIQR